VIGASGACTALRGAHRRFIGVRSDERFAVARRSTAPEIWGPFDFLTRFELGDADSSTLDAADAALRFARDTVTAAAGGRNAGRGPLCRFGPY
jgi:hypothetical protein